MTDSLLLFTLIAFCIICISIILTILYQDYESRLKRKGYYDSISESRVYLAFLFFLSLSLFFCLFHLGYKVGYKNGAKDHYNGKLKIEIKTKQDTVIKKNE